MVLYDTALVALGGATGAVLRYGVGYWWGRLLPYHSWPWATLTINLIGCLVLGLLVGYELRYGLGRPSRLLLVMGFCGGYTTYSTFALESLQLYHGGQYGLLALYLGASLLGGIGFVALGVWLMQR